MPKISNFRYNITNGYFCPMETDTAAGVTYKGTPEHLPGLMSVQETANVATGTLFGDGKKRAVVTKVTGLTLALTHNKIAYSSLAVYMGQKINEVKGVLKENSGDKAPYFAFMLEVETTEGKELWCYPKCKLSPGEKSLQQSTDNTEFSTDSYSIEVLPLEYNGDRKYIADTGDEDLRTDEEVAAAWFSAPYIETPEEPEEP